MATSNLEFNENQKNEFSNNKLYNKSLRSHLAPNGTLIYSIKPEPHKNPSLGLLKLNNKNKAIMIDTRSASSHNKIIFPKTQSVKNKSNYFNNSKKNINNYFDDEEQIKYNNQTLDTIPNFPLNYHHLPQSKVGKSIYQTLTTKKNEFLDIVNRQKEIDKLNKPNLLTRHDIMENIEFSNFFHRKKNLDDIIQNNSIRYPQFSTLKSHLSTSLKERYFSIMKSLYFLNDFIEKHPDNEEQILKEFLINHGIFDMEYYSIEKLNNFSKFLKLDFSIDLNLNFKENLINILNGKYKLNSNKKTTNKNLLNKSTNIKYYYKTFNNKKPIKKIGKLRTNLEYQKKMNESNLNNNELDLINKPKEIIDLIENEFNQELERRKNIYRKNLKSFRTNINFKNEKLYGKKKSDYDYNELKKQNKLTEYICLTKAKSNYELEELKKKYNYNI